MKLIKRNIYYMKMLFDGRYYAKICKSLQDTYLVQQTKLPLNKELYTTDYISNNFQALHTLIIQPYQTFSFNQIFRYTTIFDKLEQNLIANSLNKLIINTPLTLIEKHTIDNMVVIDQLSKDFKFINNTPFKYQIIVSVNDTDLYLNLYTEIKNVKHKT